MSGRALSAAVAAVFVVVALTVSGGMARAADEKSAGNPVLVVTPEKFDFGEVNEGDKPKATYTIKNEGTGTLQIHDIKRSCGCTVPTLTKKVLEPGESTTLEAVYNSQGYRGGTVTKSITIMSNDPANPSMAVYLTGSVKTLPAPIMSLNAPNITNLKMRLGQTERRLVKVGNSGQMELHLSEITAPTGVKVTMGEYVVEPGKTLLLEMSVKPQEEKTMELEILPKLDAPGRFAERITIRSDSKGRPVTPFVISGVVE